MEEYSDIEIDASDACVTPRAPDATPATMRGPEHEAMYQAQQVRQPGAEIEKNQSGKLGVLRPTSGNRAARFKLKAKQESRVTTRAGKSAEAVIKQFASQELQGEKEKMEGWKAIVMQEVARELQGIRRAQEEAIEAQRQSFQAELERLEKMWDEKSKLLKDEMRLLKNSGQHPARKVGEKAHTINNNRLVDNHSTGPVGEIEKGRESAEGESVAPTQRQARNVDIPTPNPGTNSQTTKKQSYASVAASKPSQAPENPWTQVKYKNRKPNSQQTSLHANGEHLGRRILFPRKTALDPQMSEADLMLVLNEALQKAGEGSRFCRVRYSPSGAVSALLTENSDAGTIIPRLSNVLIRAAKSVDQAIIGVEVLEHWQRLKIHGMPLERYLAAGSMELLKREVESSTDIQLKALPRWLINENRLREQQETGNKRGSAIVITVKGDAEAKKLCASGLRFGGVVRVVERYWEAGPSSVCMICCGIGHHRMGSCGDRPEKCLICAGPHKVENHQCGVAGCNKGKGKICAHITPKCANCGGTHVANSPRCASRHQADIKARKEKKMKEKEKEKMQAENISNAAEEEGRELSPQLDTEMEMEESWTPSPEPEEVEYEEEESQDEIPEGRDHTKDF